MRPERRSADPADPQASAATGARSLLDAFSESDMSTFGEALLGIGERLRQILRPLIETLAERLKPSLDAVASAIGGATRSFAALASDEALAAGRCLYEALLVFLEAVPGGRQVAKAVRAVVDPIFYREFRRRRLRALAIALAVAMSTPPSRVASACRLVARSTRSLRGPSAVLGIPHQPLGAALA